MLSAPPLLPYSRNRLRRLSRRLMQVEPVVTLPGHPLIIHDIHTNWIPAGRMIPEHTHSFYEAHIVLDGSPELYQPRALSGNTGITFLFPPHAPHAWQTYIRPMLSFVIWFHLEHPPLRREQVWWAHLPAMLWVVPLIFGEVQEGHPGWRERVNAYLTVALSRILTLLQEPEHENPDTEVDSMLESVVSQFLWDNLQRPLTIAEVAAHVGMSERNLYRKFHEITGQTVTQRLQKYRIQRAQTLLEESDAPLSDIGQQVGIPDPPYFCRCFKKQTGASPHQYRLSMRS